VLQGRNRLRSDVLNVYFASNAGTGGSSGALTPGRSWGRVQRAEAEGKVFFVSPSQTARGDRGLYDMSSDTITITGDVIVAQGQSVVHGQKLVIGVKSGRATMVSPGGGRSGRVRGIFYPNNATPSGAPTPPAPRQP
jgi:lipopolysaccharide export system protein LptA